MAMIDDRINLIAGQHAEALKRAVEPHIQMHEIKIDGLMRAVNLLARLLVMEGAISRENIESNAETWAERQNHVSSSSNSHNEGVALILKYCLDVSEKEPPAPPRLRVIDGGAAND